MALGAPQVCKMNASLIDPARDLAGMSGSVGLERTAVILSGSEAGESIRNGGRVEIIDRTPDISTANIIDAIMQGRQHIDLSAFAQVAEVHDDHEWGYEIWVVNNPLYCHKFLVLENGIAGSLHYHKEKHETFRVLAGEVAITRRYRVGEDVIIPPNTLHQFRALTFPTILNEVSTHHEDSDTYRVEVHDG